MRSPFGFPNPVNEKAARTVAVGVVIMSTTAVVFSLPWLAVAVALGFWARVLTGPTLSPLGRLATSVIAPRLGPPKFTPGPPKRFAQAMGVAFSTVAVILWLTVSWTAAAITLLPLIAAASLEGFFGYCLGCKIFSLLMRAGLVPESICEECADISKRVATSTTA